MLFRRPTLIKMDVTKTRRGSPSNRKQPQNGRQFLFGHHPSGVSETASIAV
jgi:hypothetical protein